MNIWKSIPSAPKYEVNNVGEVRRAEGGCGAVIGRVLKTWVSNGGYRVAGVMIDDKLRSLYVHRLVCEAFHGPAPLGNSQVAHKDGDQMNNNENNLIWATPKENQSHKWDHGTMQIGAANHNSVLTSKDIPIIRAKRANGETLVRLGKEYGVSMHTIFNVVARRSWKYIQ